MKRFLYSNYTKAIAVLLFVIFITASVLIVTDCVVVLEKEEDIIYKLEGDFTETNFFASKLHAPEAAVFSAFYNVYYTLDEDARQAIQNGNATLDLKRIEKSISQELDYLYCKDKIEYFVEINGTAFTNCGATVKEDLMDSEFYYLASRDKDGFIEKRSAHATPNIRPFIEDITIYDKTSEITIITSIKADYVAECKATWERQASILNNAAIYSFSCVILAFLILIYLICVCGKTKDGERKLIWVDNIWLEVHLIAMAAFGLGAAAVCIFLLEEELFLQPFVGMIIASVTAIASAVIINSLLSIFRNIKCKKFLETSVILRAVIWLCKIAFVILRWLRNGFIRYRNLMLTILTSKSGIMLEGLLLAYTVLMAFCAICIEDSPIGLLAFLLFGLAAYYIAYRSRDFSEIKKGVSQVRNGNVAYKIPELKSTDMKALADNINDIAKGLDDSVSARVRAERMKTELITNVSHDLKTPLTSIINYTELLSKIKGLPEEANDYIKIIASKSDRLKTLTQDLFDISKVQSGNEEIVLEKIDVSLLINQSMGEHNSEIESSNLTFCVNTPKEFYIAADGKKMSRVIGNLINNAIKYSLKNTRVFITVNEHNGEIVMEFKNIASYPMNFSPDEIVGRFVRGDESRTAEGNGLGLAIAKSYTEICNGRFDVVIDGDMFKAILKFKSYS